MSKRDISLFRRDLPIFKQISLLGISEFPYISYTSPYLEFQISLFKIYKKFLLCLIILPILKSKSPYLASQMDHMYERVELQDTHQCTFQQTCDALHYRNVMHYITITFKIIALHYNYMYRCSDNVMHYITIICQSNALHYNYCWSDTRKTGYFMTWLKQYQFIKQLLKFYSCILRSSSFQSCYISLSKYFHRITYRNKLKHSQWCYE